VIFKLLCKRYSGIYQKRMFSFPRVKGGLMDIWSKKFAFHQITATPSPMFWSALWFN